MRIGAERRRWRGGDGGLCLCPSGIEDQRSQARERLFRHYSSTVVFITIIFFQALKQCRIGGSGRGTWGGARWLSCGVPGCGGAQLSPSQSQDGPQQDGGGVPGSESGGSGGVARGGGEGGKGGGYLAGARLEQLAQLVTQQFAILRSPEPLLISADS